MTAAALQPPERDTFNPLQVSPSRLNSLVSCGIAFKMRYIDGLPEERSGSAALFGSVMHAALEKWALNRSQDLHQLVLDAWASETEGTSVNEFLALYRALSTEAIKVEHSIKARRPDIKVVRMTKDWKTSPIAGQINALIAKWLPRLEKESPWRFNDRDPLPSLYDESRVLAKRYEAKWKHLPPAIHTEMAFNEPYEGFTIKGYIDAIETLVHPETGELQGIGILDYKTYRHEPPEYKDWRQVVMYDVAIRSLVDRGALTLPHDISQVPLYIGIDYVRLLERSWWQAEEADYTRLKRELESYRSIVEAGAFLPAEKGRNPDFCDYPGQCCLRTCTAAGGASPRVEVVQ